MKNIASLVFLLLTSSLAYGVELSPNEFAYGFSIQTDTNRAIYQFELPAQVYESSAQPNLTDIRIFNADDEVVPHVVQTIAAEISIDRKIEELPIFPQYTALTEALDPKNLKFAISEDGRIVEHHNQGPEIHVQDANIDTYIIDLSQIKKTITKLKVKLNSDKAHYIQRIKLDSSNDLVHWKKLVTDVALVKLDYQGHELAQNEFSLPKQPGKYLRLTFNNRVEGLQVLRISAVLKEVHRKSHPEEKTIVSTGKVSDKKQESGIFYYDLNGHFPVQKINLTFDQANTLARATISSRNAESQTWRVRKRTVFYSLDINGASLNNNEIELPNNADRFWRVIIDDPEMIGDQIPGLRATWFPHQIQFVARGSSPFTLAFGNGQLDKPATPAHNMLKVLKDAHGSDLVGQASLSIFRELGGEQRLSLEYRVNWRTVVLWSLLVSAVGSLGFMAMRLIKQMH